MSICSKAFIVLCRNGPTIQFFTFHVVLGLRCIELLGLYSTKFQPRVMVEKGCLKGSGGWPSRLAMPGFDIFPLSDELVTASPFGAKEDAFCHNLAPKCDNQIYLVMLNSHEIK